MPRQTNKQETRLSIRANQLQKSVLSRAAAARNMNVSQFVLSTSLREAEQVINEETRLVVSPQDYDWLVKLMDEASPAPRLREAFSKKPVWNA